MYINASITIMLPAGTTVANIDWLSVWDDFVYASFGHVTVPDNALVPVYIPSDDMPYFDTTEEPYAEPEPTTGEPEPIPTNSSRNGSTPLQSSTVLHPNTPPEGKSYDTGF